MTTIILAHDGFLDGEAKTAEALIRYGTDPVSCVIDASAGGAETTKKLPRVEEPVRVVPSMDEALATDPDRCVIGVAPVGGQLPDAWRDDLADALEAGTDVVSGLHDRLAKDPVLQEAAASSGATIEDVRVPPDTKPIYSAEVLDVDATIVLTVGTDCSSGKMTTTVELLHELRDRGRSVAFAATGQTGLMLGPDAGVPIDAVPSDFTAGHGEDIVLRAQRAQDAEIVLVEGQGALTHPAYAGVSLGLLHGASPHACVLCHDAARDHKTASFHEGRRFPVLSPQEEWSLVTQLAEQIRPVELAGVSVMNGPLPKDQIQALPQAPLVDVLEEGPGRLADAVEELT